MKFRGLDPRTRTIRWGLFAVAVGLVVGATVPSALHGLSTAWATNRAILPWVAERTFAFLAYGAMTGSVVYGLLLSTKILDVIAHRPITFALHQDLASIGVGLAAVHGMLLALDRTVPFSIAQIAVPGLAPYAPVGVALGQVGFYLMAIVVGSFYLRRRIGQRAWRLLHYVTFLAFVGSTAHGLVAGTDSATPWAWWLYVSSTVTVVFLLAYRVTLSIAARVVPEARPTRVPNAVRTGPAPAGDASSPEQEVRPGRPLPLQLDRSARLELEHLA
jgi:DMSO/TMAO reductase YedYZ heme-binding membrane subunit